MQPKQPRLQAGAEPARSTQQLPDPGLETRGQLFLLKILLSPLGHSQQFLKPPVPRTERGSDTWASSADVRKPEAERAVRHCLLCPPPPGKQLPPSQGSCHRARAGGNQGDGGRWTEVGGKTPAWICHHTAVSPKASTLLYLGLSFPPRTSTMLLALRSPKSSPREAVRVATTCFP